MSLVGCFVVWLISLSHCGCECDDVSICVREGKGKFVEGLGSEETITIAIVSVHGVCNPAVYLYCLVDGLGGMTLFGVVVGVLGSN